MRLSVRLLALGVTGPLVGLGLFLGLSTISIVNLARVAKLDISQLFDEVNLNNMRTASDFVSLSTNRLATGLNRDVGLLSAEINQSLGVKADGSLTWKGTQIPAEQLEQRLVTLLKKPLRSPEESSSILYRDPEGHWRRLAGVSSEGTRLASGWRAPAAAADNLEVLISSPSNQNPAHNTMIKWGENWQMARIQALGTTKESTRLALVVSLPTDAAKILLETSAHLLPYKNHRVAFYGRSADGQLFCTYSFPTTKACPQLQSLLKRSRGMPSNVPEGVKEIQLSDNQDRPEVSQRLFVMGFPNWNWLAVVQISTAEFTQAWEPLRKEAVQLITVLVVGTAVLIGGCALAAWRISEGIKKELRQLADGANALAEGGSRLRLIYSGQDALGRLVAAFNRMAEAVADREDRLKDRIQVLEININERDLHGQVRSITDDPHFTELSERARAMRNRRQRRPPKEPAA